jgi:hypothetical protein
MARMPNGMATMPNRAKNIRGTFETRPTAPNRLANDKIQPSDHSTYPRRRTLVGSYRHVPRGPVRMMHPRPERTGPDWISKGATQPSAR